MGSKVLIYDCEIINDPNAHGWGNYQALGISVIGCHADWLDQPLISFDNRDPDYLAKFQGLVNQADWVCGFNSVGFDDPLCRAHGVDIDSDIDLLCQIRILSGQPAYYVAGVTRVGYSLNACALANGIRAKTGNGALAPLWWQQGKHDRVIEYCLNDVTITRLLYEKWRDKQLIDPTTGVKLQ